MTHAKTEPLSLSAKSTGKLPFSFKSPKRKVNMTKTAFETIEELRQETQQSEENSDNSSVDVQEPTNELIIDDDSLQSTTRNEVSKG